MAESNRYKIEYQNTDGAFCVWDGMASEMAAAVAQMRLGDPKFYRISAMWHVQDSPTQKEMSND